MEFSIGHYLKLYFFLAGSLLGQKELPKGPFSPPQILGGGKLEELRHSPPTAAAATAATSENGRGGGGDCGAAAATADEDSDNNNSLDDQVPSMLNIKKSRYFIPVMSCQ